MKKILLLDDNPDSLQLAEDVLTYEKYEVKTYHLCAGFIKLAEEFRPDLMIIDYRLEDGNGGDLCREIKNNPTLLHTPVMLFSAEAESHLQLLDYGCEAVIAKPFDLINFLTTVRKLTE